MLAAVLCGVNLAFYGTSPYLSGDQAVQLVGAESLIADGDLFVPPHPSTSAGDEISLDRDQRERLFWFPPGYSVLLAIVGSLCGSMASAALVIYVLNRWITTVLWWVVLRREHFPRSIAAVSLLVPHLLYGPSTTTDQLLWPVTACMFLFIRGNHTSARTAGMTVLFAYAISIRWFSVILPGIWLLFCMEKSLVNKRPLYPTFVHCGLPLIISAAAYLGLSFWASGGMVPYTAGQASTIHWKYLFKGVFYAIDGGWSVPFLYGKVVLVCLSIALLIQIGYDLWSKFRLTPALTRSIIFQGAIFIFLIIVMLRKGAMYDPLVPAFATARFFMLIQPLSISLIAGAPGMLFQRSGPRRIVNIISAAAILISALPVVHDNQLESANISVDSRGFLRDEDYAQLERALNKINPDAILIDSNPQLFAIYDSQKTFPISMNYEGIADDALVVWIRARIAHENNKSKASRLLMRTTDYEIVELEP